MISTGREAGQRAKETWGKGQGVEIISSRITIIGLSFNCSNRFIRGTVIDGYR
jgi:hypothetical protein